MKECKWNEEKNKYLKRTKGASFEDILNSRFISAEKHPSRKNQMILLFEHKSYVWIVPCVVGKNYIFLKTLFPSRKYTNKYKNKRGDKK